MSVLRSVRLGDLRRPIEESCSEDNEIIEVEDIPSLLELLVDLGESEHLALVRSDTAALITIGGSNEVINLGGSLGMRYALLFAPSISRRPCNPGPLRL